MKATTKSASADCDLHSNLRLHGSPHRNMLEPPRHLDLCAHDGRFHLTFRQLSISIRSMVCCCIRFCKVVHTKTTRVPRSDVSRAGPSASSSRHLQHCPRSCPPRRVLRQKLPRTFGGRLCHRTTETGSRTVSPHLLAKVTTHSAQGMSTN